MNKKLLILLAIALVILPVAACGRTAPTGVTTVPGPKIPHAVDVRFENCNACHVADQLAATSPLPHIGMNYTNKDCISVACHVAQAGATTPPPNTTPTSTTPGGSTPAGSTPGGSTTPTATLPAVGVAITYHKASDLVTQATLCLICHGPTGGQPQPYAGTWNATASNSVHNTGVFTVAAGSPADHTGYTNADCTKAGCHAAPTS